MARSWGSPYSSNPYAPQIPYWLYFAEKANFAGFLIGAIFYGTPTHLASLLSVLTLPLDHHFRDRHRPLLPMSDRVVQFQQSHKEGCQMGICRLRRRHVLVRDRIHRDEPQHSIHFLHR